MEENKNSVQTTITEDEKEIQGEDFSLPSTADKDTETAEKTKQSKEQNSEYARKRREIKRAEELKKARIDGIREVISTNPFTNEPIIDEDDIEEYLLMKKIENGGKDPIQDYPKYVKELKKNERSVKKQNSENEKEEFSKCFPNVNIDELQNDTLFSIFSKGKNSKMSLLEIYSEYDNFLSYVRESEQIKSAVRMANSRASVGSLQDEQGTTDEYFTKDEVSAMSPAEINKNYEKIRKSQLKW